MLECKKKYWGEKKVSFPNYIHTYIHTYSIINPEIVASCVRNRICPSKRMQLLREDSISLRIAIVKNDFVGNELKMQSRKLFH